MAFNIQQPIGFRSVRSRVVRMAKMAAADDARLAEPCQLLDLTAASAGVSGSDVRRLLYAHAKLATRYRWQRLAVVVDRAWSLRLIGLIEWQYRHRQPEVRVFYRRDAAERWLQAG